MKRWKRTAALLLTVLLTVGILPLGASAQDTRPTRIRELVPTDIQKENLEPLIGLEATENSDIVPHAASVTSGTCGDNLTWAVEGNTLTISGTGDMYDYSDYDNPAPWSESSSVIIYIYIEDGVTSIGQEAFSNCSRLLDCHIPPSVSYVDRDAFYAVDNGRLYFWGDAPEFHAEAFSMFEGYAFHFRPWDSAVIQNYGGEPTWERGTVKLSSSNKQLYSLNEEIKAEDLLFYAYAYSAYTFDYTPGEIIIGDYDNSTYGEKTVQITADGHELTYNYYVTDGENHLDLITVEYDPIIYYTGFAYTFDPIVKAGDKVLNKGEHYRISHENNQNVGTDGSFTITGMGIYEGFRETYPFTILKTDLSDAEVTVENTNFYGMPIEPDVSVQIYRNGFSRVLNEGTDYELIYEDNVNVGTGTVRVVGKGGFYGTATETFQIQQGDTTIWLPGAYNGSAQDDELNDDYYYAEGILCPGVFTGRLEAYNYHVAYYSLYRIEGEDLVLVTEHETEYSHNHDTTFTYDFTDVYNSTSEEGGETYMLIYTWLDMDYDIYSGALVMYVPSKVPGATVMTIEQLADDGDFRQEYLMVAGEDGVVDDMTTTSSDENVATIENGVMMLKNPGNVTVTARSGDACVSRDIIVDALDLKAGVIFNYDTINGTANVIYGGKLLQDGTDYTLSVNTADGITEVRAEGMGLFGGQLVRQFDTVTGEAIGHTHTYDNACDGTCGGCTYARAAIHQYGSQWTKDMDGHWHGCAVCGDKADYAEHTLSGDGQCAVCGSLYTPGDVDSNFSVNEDDAIYLLQHVLLPDFFPVDQDVDYNEDGQINEDDAIYLLQHVLLPDFFPL